MCLVKMNMELRGFGVKIDLFKEFVFRINFYSDNGYLGFFCSLSFFGFFYGELCCDFVFLNLGICCF